jgi:hypothetical protein
MAKIVFASIVLLAGLLVFVFKNKEPREQRQARLNQCLSEKLPEIKTKYESQGLAVGEPKIWMDWFEANEYAVYPLLKNGKQENKRSATISTLNGCSWMEIEYSAN